MSQNLPWDHPQNPFRGDIIHEYPLWVLYLNRKQGYLGRSYAWLKREGKVGFSELTNEEHLELRLVIHWYERALFRAFGFDSQVDLVNYAWLANHVAHGHHGHMHFIPRFKEPKVHPLLGFSYGGERWGENYVPDPARILSEEEYGAIRHLIALNICLAKR